MFDFGKRILKPAAVLGALGALAGIIFTVVQLFYLGNDVIQKIRTTQAAQDREYIKFQFYRTYHQFRENFVDLALVAMDMDSTHQTLPLSDKTVMSGKRCAVYRTAMNGFFEATEYLGLSRSSESGPEFRYNDMDADMMSARIAIMEAIDNESIRQPRAEGEIMGLLARHDTIAVEKNHLDYLKFSWALRGLFFLERAKKLASEAQLDSIDVKLSFERAIAMYDSANMCYHMEPGVNKNSNWSHSTSSIAAITEYKCVLFEVDSVQRKMAERFKKSVGYSGIMPQKIESAEIARTFSNLAEIYLMDDSLDQANCILESEAISSWCQSVKPSISSTTAGENLRTSYESLMGLRVYCRIMRCLADTVPIDSVAVRSLKATCELNNLFSSEYSGYLTDVSWKLLEARYSSQQHDTSASERWERLESEILKNYSKWLGPGGQSRPRILLKKLCTKALDEWRLNTRASPS